MKKYWIVSCVLVAAIAVATAVLQVMSITRAAAAPGATNAAAILVDHNTVDAAQIPQEWLDAARELDTFFAHKSVGNNILDGMVDLQGQNPTRYAIDIVVEGPDWFAANSGISHQSLGTNGQPQTKIDGFDAFIRGGYHAADAAMMKFCPGDTLPFGIVPAADIWVSYRDMMAALESAYPGTTIVWWTMPIATAADDRGNDEKEIFNGLMRDYCDVNICVLFDIADIESHDPDGNPVVSPAGYEAMWGDYASDGAHLNETGRQRVAAAFWHLFARIAGWDPESPEPSFTLGITPELVEVEQGRTAVYTISVQSVGGFSQSVQLSATGLPTDTAVSWSANPLPPDQSATISATVSDTASVGDYLFAVIGSANMLAKTVTATLNVLEAPPEPDFALDVTPEWAETEQGRTAVYTVSVQSINGFTQSVQMEAAALPEETAVSWQENPLASDQSTTMTVTVGVVVLTGDYLFNVIGAAGALTDTVTATLRVREPSEPGFVMSVTPESVNVIWGAAAVYTITVYGVGGFTQLVQLDTAGLPGGTAVSWQDNPLSPNETTIMTVAVDTIVPCADYPFNVVGTAGTLTETSSITLGVRRPTYLPLILRDYTSP